KGNAYVTPLRDKTHGRVYRITFTSGQPSRQFRLDKASTQELVDALKSDNQLWRMHAQRLLVERGDRSVIPALIELVRNTTVDAIGLNPTAIHALWTLHGLNAISEDSTAMAAAQDALKHPSPGVRKAAVEVLPASDRSSQAILAARLIEDADAQVKKSA